VQAAFILAIAQGHPGALVTNLVAGEFRFFDNRELCGEWCIRVARRRVPKKSDWLLGYQIVHQTLIIL
jgi:hypothetical protein